MAAARMSVVRGWRIGLAAALCLLGPLLASPAARAHSEEPSRTQTHAQPCGPNPGIEARGCFQFGLAPPPVAPGKDPGLCPDDPRWRSTRVQIQAVQDQPGPYGVAGSFALVFKGPITVTQTGRTTEFSTQSNAGGTGDVAAPLLLPGRYEVRAQYLGDGRRVKTHLHGTQPAPLTLIFTPSDYPGQLKIEDCEAAIQGQVADSDGLGIKGARISVDGGGVTRTARTDGGGSYRVPVPRGRYVVRASVGDELVRPRERRVTVKSKTVRANFLVPRRRIRGRVSERDCTQEQCADVRGVGGMRVVALSAIGGKTYETTTLADGSFDIKAPPGRYDVQPGFGEWDPPSRIVDLPETRDVDGVDFDRCALPSDSRKASGRARIQAAANDDPCGGAFRITARIWLPEEVADPAYTTNNRRTRWNPAVTHLPTTGVLGCLTNAQKDAVAGRSRAGIRPDMKDVELHSTYLGSGTNRFARNRYLGQLVAEFRYSGRVVREVATSQTPGIMTRKWTFRNAVLRAGPFSCQDPKPVELSSAFEDGAPGDGNFSLVLGTRFPHRPFDKIAALELPGSRGPSWADRLRRIRGVLGSGQAVSNSLAKLKRLRYADPAPLVIAGRMTGGIGADDPMRLDFTWNSGGFPNYGFQIEHFDRRTGKWNRVGWSNFESQRGPDGSTRAPYPRTPGYVINDSSPRDYWELSGLNRLATDIHTVWDGETLWTNPTGIPFP